MAPMTRTFLTLGAILGLGLPAWASDALPLRRGIFVDAAVPCAERSNATVTSFWGDSLNTARTACRIERLDRRGSDYRFGCRRPWAYGSQHLTVESPTAFVQHHPDYGTGRTRYRWCAAAM